MNAAAPERNAVAEEVSGLMERVTFQSPVQFTENLDWLARQRLLGREKPMVAIR
jgi:hypothetical protein